MVTNNQELSIDELRAETETLLPVAENGLDQVEQVEHVVVVETEQVEQLLPEVPDPVEATMLEAAP